jgi:hypothetical protein
MEYYFSSLCHSYLLTLQIHFCILFNTSGKAGAQIPHLPLGDDSSPWGI